MRDPRVILIDMPWSMLHRPSIQLGVLRSVLENASIGTGVRSFSLAFMDHLVIAHSKGLTEKQFSYDDYLDVAEYYCNVGLGDWIFAVPPFREPGDWEERYLQSLRDRGGQEKVIETAKRMRRLVPEFLEWCVEDILTSAPAVVGFTTTFSQNVSSLVLAKLLKSHDPALQIVFGGSNCDGPMGEAMHRAFPWIDVVVRGEGERVLPELIRNLFDGGTLRPQPGLCFRSGGQRVVSESDGRVSVPMEEVPVPNYDEYFERLQRSPLRAEILPHLTIPFESARGCWWGAKKHCTFCGLNGSTMAFRSKSPELVVEMLVTLAQKYGRLDFAAVDNIIDMRYFDELLPKLRDTGHDFSLFYETKANLKKEHLRAMRDAGVLSIQPGIESLSTPILRLMDKGVTALQNIRLLKWCAEFGIEPEWFVLYGFPGEPSEEYDRMADVMKSLTHLTPPGNFDPVQVERFSPYYDHPHEYGLKITGPRFYYPLIYSEDHPFLSDLAYSFEHSYADDRDPQSYNSSIRESIENWRRDYEGGSTLTCRRGPGFLLIDDRRPGLGGYNYSLRETEANIYLTCESGVTARAAWKAVEADAGKDINLQDVEDFLEEMTERRLMYEEGGLYLSLAVPSDSTVRERSRQSEETASIQSELVELSKTGDLVSYQSVKRFH